MIYPNEKGNLKPGRHAVMEVFEEYAARPEVNTLYVYAGVIVRHHDDLNNPHVLLGTEVKRVTRTGDIVAVADTASEAKAFVEFATREAKRAEDRVARAKGAFKRALDKRLGIKRPKAAKPS